MERYFHIRYEFDRAAVHRHIAAALAQPPAADGQGRAGYICVADGNVLTHVQKDAAYRRVVDGALFSICDSSWVPLYLKWLYDIRREQYCGAQIFEDIVCSGRYRMAFLGTDDETLAALKAALIPRNPAVEEMPFISLPYRAAEAFDYPAIAAELNAAGADIIWVALGAPKQDEFMQLLTPHLRRGLAIGVGAVFNFVSGRVPRAPKAIVALHLEFAWRLLREPRKQATRCWNIATTLPRLLLEERKRRHTTTPGNDSGNTPTESPHG